MYGPDPQEVHHRTSKDFAEGVLPWVVEQASEFVGLLVQDEKTHRDNLRLRRLLKKARLRQEAALEDIDYGASRGLSRQVLLELSSSQWVAAHRTVLVSGPFNRTPTCSAVNRLCICIYSSFLEECYKSSLLKIFKIAKVLRQ